MIDIKRCNKELIKEIDSHLTIPSEICSKACTCDQPNLANADIKDINTIMDDRSFYEVTDFTQCEDLFMNANEETLWVAICGEIKTPYRALSNSVGQMNYGCRIWDLQGQNIDGLLIKEFESYIIETCLKYPEVNNVLSIKTYVGNEGSLLVTLKIDSQYGLFEAKEKIPFARASNKNWKPASTVYSF